MRIVAAILAREESPTSPDHLLPQRSLAMVRGRPVIEWLAERLPRSRRLDQVVAAVGHEGHDAQIVVLARQLDLPVYQGHPDSILDRLYLVARAENADHVVRINGNFPLVDVSSMDELIAAHLRIKADFSLNSHYHGVVYGLGVEIFSTSALKRATSMHRTAQQKRIGASYLHQFPEKYKTYFQPADRTAPHFRVSVDFASDLQVVSEILSQVPEAGNRDVIEFLNDRPDLVASQEIAAPTEVCLEKALLFPDKIQALRLNNCVTCDTTYPISVELSLTNRCNHNCIWCSDAELRERLGGEFNPDVLYALFEQLKAGGTRGIVIEGGGEPTLHPDFNGIVQRARELDLAIGLITNGFILPPTRTIRHFEWIRISLDAAARRQYRALKGVDGFNRVINNLMSLAAERKNTILGMGYVLTNRNDDLVDLEQLVLFLRKIGIQYIQIRPVVDHPELTSRKNLEFLKKFETDIFSVNLSGMNDNQEAGNHGLPCLAHSLSTVIAADGSVYLCGRLNNFQSWEPLGNIHDQTFHEIWRGPKRRDQVRTVYEADFCRRYCPQCRMTKYNRLLNDMERIKTRNFI